MIHKWEVVVNVEREVVIQLLLSVTEQVIAQEPEQRVVAQSRTNGRRLPYDTVIYLLLVWVYDSSLGNVVIHRCLGKQSGLLLVYDLVGISLWKERPILNMRKNVTKMCVKSCLELDDVRTSMFPVRKIIPGSADNFLALILRILFNAFH